MEALESDLAETLLYVVVIGLLPYVLVEVVEMLQRTLAKRRGLSRH